MAEQPAASTGDHSETEDFQDASENEPKKIDLEIKNNSDQVHGVESNVTSAVEDKESGIETADQKKSEPATTTNHVRKGSLATLLGSVSVKSRSESIDHSEAASKDGVMKPPPKPSRFGTFSASLPSVPWGATKAVSTQTARSPSPQPPPKDNIQMPPSVQKRTTPFGWLSRTTSIPKETLKSPPLVPSRTVVRRGTTASMSTLGSNQDLMLKTIDESQDTGAGRNPARNSLKERFKLLRMREEAGIIAVEDPEERPPEDGETSKKRPDLHINIASPTDTDGNQMPLKSPAVNIPPSPAPTIDQHLGPGMVSGFSVAAVDSAMPIDWDFWQTVVTEGPAAVARTSPEELTAAIAGGIPSTIRGVIWQVLAGSKNEELEQIYQELKLRGTKDEMPRNPSISGSLQTDLREKESTASSRSSIRSTNSTPATSTNAGISSPTQEAVDPIKDAKEQAQSAADQAKRAKENAASLSKLEKMIRRDMGSRTSYSKYSVAAGFQDGLFNVCKAYALFDEAVGYPQGMNFIIMPLLFSMPEEEAFCLLVKLMNRYKLRELFVEDMPGLHLNLYQFERLLEDLEPALYCHLNRRGVTPRLYATQWFLTLFAYRFPLQLVMRVFDMILCEGLEAAMLKLSMALMQKNVENLLEMNDMQQLTNFLKERIFDVYIDQSPSKTSILESGFFGSSGGSENDIYRADLLVRDASAVSLTTDMLARYASEWEEKITTEKARETELDNLRTDTATKAAQIRSLELRAERGDTEHIEIANELVKLKVQNQDLLDENESLKGQVEELRKVAESEGQKVQDEMKLGIEKVMQRNVEVQNQNRHLEEQMAEMERELVESKMKWAELNNDHEQLKQRWTDLRKAIE